MPTEILGGLSPRDFMKLYWQKKPLLVRGAFKDIKPPLNTTALKKLARQDDVESRLIWQENGSWQMEHGPFSRFPARKEPGWTLLVQSIDLHDDNASELLHTFDFIPSARLDDLMVSIATEGGGVGPHFDSYDVFLIQAQGTRRWRYGQQKDLTLVEGLPLKILKHFEPEQDVVLEPGDMLYLPPHAAHDGIAMSNDCMTLSVGFRSPQQATLAQGMLEAAAEQIAARNGAGCGMYSDPPLPGPTLDKHYKDPEQPATAQSALIPPGLIEATLEAIRKIKLDDETLAVRFLGCWLTEPNPIAVFDYPDDEVLDQFQQRRAAGSWRLDRRTRMLYRDKSLFINGELAPVPVTPLLQQLADNRTLNITATQAKRLPQNTLECLSQWLESGWIHYIPD